MRLFMLSMLVVCLGSPAHAGVPARLPIQGYLTDAAAMPITGNRQITFKLYDDATMAVPWYTETQVVSVDQGDFTVYLGALTPLDLTQLRRGTAFLGITLQGESEMTPRLEMASVPFAAYAQYAQETAAVPPGAVMMFDLATCPPGWTALDAARGRALVGLPAGGELRGSVGTALADKENRVHTHLVDTPACTMSQSGAHSHTVTVSQSNTGSSGAHAHEWSSYNVGTGVWSTFDSSGAPETLVTWGDGMDSAGTGQFPLEFDFGAATVGTFRFHTATSSNHTHTVPAINTSTGFSSTHSHTCDPAGTASMPAATADVMPYLQLLVCRKD